MPAVALCCFFFYCLGGRLLPHFSLHDALPILSSELVRRLLGEVACESRHRSSGSSARCAGSSSRSWSKKIPHSAPMIDRKSTRLNSSHPSISYAVFCLKKKKIKTVDVC